VLTLEHKTGRRATLKVETTVVLIRQQVGAMSS
jgi:hypothetical protein